MRGYAAQVVFDDSEKRLLRMVETLVEPIPYCIEGKPVRCHELARAVGHLTGLEVADGHYGFAEHSWLWTTPLVGHADDPPVLLPNVLDVYTPGALPQVQLVHLTSGLPARYNARPIKDLVIHADVVRKLIDIMDAVFIGYGMKR